MVVDKDKGWNKFKREIKITDKSFVLIGYIAGKVAPLDVKKSIWAEFGTERGDKLHSPPRPFSRYTFSKYRTKVNKFIDKKYGKMQQGVLTAFKAISHVGEFYLTLLKLSIRTGPWLPNAPSTLAGKKSTKPLIDTREMLKAPKYKVVIKRI
jgi:hypothetical protein